MDVQIQGFPSPILTDAQATNILDIEDEVHRKKRQRLREPPGYTSNDFAMSNIKKHYILNQVTSQVFEDNNAPAWAIDLGNRIDNINENMNRMVDSINALNANYEWSVGISVFSHNHCIRMINKRLLPNDQPVPLLKEVPGIGDFPNLRTVDAPVVANRVGETPVFFPQTFEQELTLAQLSQLSRFYNQSFGVVNGDTAAIKNQKFYSWIGKSSPPLINQPLHQPPPPPFKPLPNIVIAKPLAKPPAKPPTGN